MSTVVGVVLLVGIVIAIAALVAMSLTDVGESVSEPAPQIRFEIDYHARGADNGGKPYFVLTHRGGDLTDGEDLYIRDEDGNTVSWETVWTTDPTASPTDYAHIDGSGSDGALNHVCDAGQTYQLIKRGEDRSYVIAEYEVPRDSDPGISGWC